MKLPDEARAEGSGGAVLRVKKLKGAGIVRAAAAHNKRSIQAEIGTNASIDPQRTVYNECIAGPPTADDVAGAARSRMAESGIVRLRKDAVRALEFVVSLAPTHGIDERAFFLDVVDWMGIRFGGSHNVLSADIHRDEPAPHLHVLVLPLLNGRMTGSDAIGGRQALASLHQDFHAKVASPYGLKRAPARLQGGAKATAVSAVLTYLRRASDAAMHSAAWSVIRECIERDPTPFLAALGIEVPNPNARRLRSMAAIFTSKGKGSSKSPPDLPYRVQLAPTHEPYAL